MHSTMLIYMDGYGALVATYHAQNISRVSPDLSEGLYGYGGAGQPAQTPPPPREVDEDVLMR